MPSANYRPPQIPTSGVDVGGVAAASTVVSRRMNTSLRQAGGQSGSGRTVTADTFISTTDTFVWADTTANTVSLTLPAVKEYTRMWVIVERTAGANALTILPRGTDTIDSGASLVVTKPVMLTPKDNATWHVAMTSA